MRQGRHCKHHAWTHATATCTCVADAPFRASRLMGRKSLNGEVTKLTLAVTKWYATHFAWSFPLSHFLSCLSVLLYMKIFTPRATLYSLESDSSGSDSNVCTQGLLSWNPHVQTRRSVESILKMDADKTVLQGRMIGSSSHEREVYSTRTLNCRRNGISSGAQYPAARLALTCKPLMTESHNESKQAMAVRICPSCPDKLSLGDEFELDRG